MHKIFESLIFPDNAQITFNEKTLFVKKWNWEYQECELFQQAAQKIIQKNRDFKVYVFTNHPHCFTLGRGNERGQDLLVNFDETLVKVIDFPLYRIHRGGGVTFHYPGQWIFYPIVALKESFSLEDLTCWLLKSVKTTLTDDFGIDDVITATKLMGVWRKKKKLASIGVGVSRFVTIHGIALNLITDSKMVNELKKINPCGINPDTYICADQVMPNPVEDLVEAFHSKYLSNLLN